MRAAWAGVIAFLAAPPVRGQVPGQPVHFSPSHGPRGVVHADVGAGAGRYVGGRVTAGLPLGGNQMVLLGVGAGWLSAPREPGVGGLLGLTLLQGAEFPLAVSLQAGLGYVVEQDAAQNRLRQWDIPLGLGLAAEPLVGGVDLEPWIGLRYHLRHYRAQIGSTVSDTWEREPGLSAGVRLTLFQPAFLRRWGLHVALDWMRMGDPYPITIGRPTLPVFSVGLHRCVLKCPL